MSRYPPARYSFNQVELPLDVFEYKPEIPLSQAQQNFSHKYRFDKLDELSIKRPKSQATSTLQARDGTVDDYKDIPSIDGERKSQYDHFWLQK
jgi:hypothetical protein